MAIRPPALDDRDFDDLVEEVLARVPAHTPEWVPRLGDPGRTLVELFAWLTDTLLYRANLVPEKQRLAFLRLLGENLRPARAARTLIAVLHDDPRTTSAPTLAPLAKVQGTADFETLGEVTVFPVAAAPFYKRPLDEAERTKLGDVLDGLREIYQVPQARPYVATPVFVNGAADRAGLDVVQGTADRCLWLALLSATAELRDPIRQSLAKNPTGGPRLLNVGVAPAIDIAPDEGLPQRSDNAGHPARIPHVWEITGETAGGRVTYHALDVQEDTTAGLTRPGVLRLLLPGQKLIQAPTNDVRKDVFAGVGDRPPRLDDPDTSARLVAWVRLRPDPTARVERLALSWVGINAVEVDQRQTITGRVVGQSDGRPDQEFRLHPSSVEAATLSIQVEESQAGYQTWQAIDDLGLAGRDDAVYELDSEGGTVRFGDGLRGRVPAGRIRVGRMRVGGGAAGNVPAGSLTKITAVAVDGAPLPRLKCAQTLAAVGGEDAESLEAAERRIPAMLRHGERSVTAADYEQLAAETPGVRLGRVEVLPLFKPHQRRSGVPGVITVMVWPQQEAVQPPNPRVDRPLLTAVHNHLDARRPLATELYVIGCEYAPLGLSLAITIRDGAPREGTLNAVRQALRRYLWPLPPDGPFGAGWPLGRTVDNRELEVAAARVDGVQRVNELNLFERRENEWRLKLPASTGGGPQGCLPVRVELQPWQVPELLSVVVVAADGAPRDLSGVPNPFADESAVAVPVVLEVC